jgi:transcription antitermination factor NusG
VVFYASATGPGPNIKAGDSIKVVEGKYDDFTRTVIRQTTELQESGTLKRGVSTVPRS